MEKLRKFKNLRSSCLNDMQILFDISENAKVDKSVRSMYQARYNDIENLKENFLEQHNNIISTLLTKETDVDSEDNIRTCFLNQYFQVKATYSEIFNNTDLNKIFNNSATCQNSQQHIKLPKLELQKFRGNFREFASFIDLFNSVVHNNDSLSDIQKFQYLKGFLEGPPLGLIRNLPLTEQNYNVAYDLLVKRYTNKRRCAKAHWDAILNVPKLTTVNVTSLSNLIDTFQENLAALKSIGLPTEHWDYVVFMFLFSRLDPDTIKLFELENKSTEIPSYGQLIEFLESQLIAYDNFSEKPRLGNAFSSNKPQSPKPNYHNSKRVSNLLASKSVQQCVFCKEAHGVYDCPEFLSQSPFDRHNMCKSAHLCFNCLSSSHGLRECSSKYSCRKCKSSKHHTLLHFESKPIRNGNVATSSSQPVSNQPTTSLVITPQTLKATCLLEPKPKQNDEVLLSTSLVNIPDKHNVKQTVRCLIDPGSMSSFILRKTANRLGLPKTQCQIEVQGLDSMKTQLNTEKISLSITPREKENPIFYVEAIILDRICNDMPSIKLSSESWTHLTNLNLADPNFNVPGPIELLLGADVFSKLLLSGKISGNPGEPDAINTALGYILSGQVVTQRPSVTSLFCGLVNDTPLDNIIKKFWEVEDVPETSHINLDEQTCEQIFKENHSRDGSGRYIVPLPFKESSPTFPGIRDLALQRFYSREHRLIAQPDLHKQYSDFMQEYLELNHMELVPKNELGKGQYYIPHQCVVKPDSVSTKLRVVFDASAKTPNGKSLNDCLYVGPKLQQDIVSILINFRLYKFVMCADVKQMYRMILISPEFRDYQRIFYRFSPEEEIQEYRLVTVTYGVSSAPYLALATLRQLAIDEESRFPKAASIILNSSYIDDFVFGANTLDEAQSLLQDLIALMESGGFSLRKWCTNHPPLLAHMPPSHINPNTLNLEQGDKSSSLKVLGLKWNPVNDCFFFSVIPNRSLTCSKRSLLSELARIYDPLGFLSPITFLTKSLIQRLWMTGLNWDDSPPPDIVRMWNQYLLELPLLSQLQIPRKLFLNISSNCELHGFCDASEKGYACVVYFRTFYSDYQPALTFICAKSKIAPLKTKLTIPRLELCAAVLLSKLISYILKVCTINVQSVHAWSDSQIVLHWINSSPHRFKTFVANRISYIQSKVPNASWKYVPTHHNAADVASRGLLPHEFLANNSWIHGPSFLLSSSFCFPDTSLSGSIQFPVEEERKIVLLTEPSQYNALDALLENHSSFSKIIRILAYVLRFIHNTKPSSPKQSSEGLQAEELEKSMLILVRHTQHVHFDKEFNSKKLSKPLLKLGAFKDNHQLLRVGGRLTHSPLSYEAKHPLLLPRKCRLTTLVIDYYHIKHLHAGFKTTQFLISQKFWILCPKRAINAVLSKCVRCWKQNPKPYQPPMGNLPQFRFNDVKAFSHCGLDFGGPFSITPSRYRGSRTIKAYLCLFVCCATKALHLELVSNLTTDGFLAALQRFIARRGRVSHIYCDNGTNFIGAEREIAQFMQSAADRETIKFHFSPPSGPHFGGLWEAGIKSVKRHLIRVVGMQILTYEEFYTVLVLIESLLNSRPLTPFSNDIEDITALTPGHFLTLEPLTTLPTPDYTPIPMNRLSRWQLLQRLHRDFWTRWQCEYLHSLQQRSKWLTPIYPSPTVGTLVLIKEDNSPPARWTLARIIELHFGKDGVSRVASVRTPTGTLRRPLVKLCPLPFSDD